MTSGRTHKCPLCGSPLTRQQYEKVLNVSAARDKELAADRANLREQQHALAAQRQRLAAEVDAAARKAATQARRAQEQLERQLDKARAQLAEQKASSGQERDRLARSISSKLETQFAARLRRAEDDRRKADERRERENEGWKKKLDELQRRTEARDHLHFGPEGEIQLAAVLKRQFPNDDIERKGKGVDVLHRVIDRDEQCGAIVYECKRTATWQTAFVQQLKRSMETYGTRWGVLVSRALPAKESGLCVHKGVIVVTPPLAHHLAGILRDVVVDLSRASLTPAGKQAKAEEIFRYLRSDEFLSAMRVVHDRIADLRTALQREKATHENLWSAREQHYSSISQRTAAIESRIGAIVSDARGQRRRSHLSLTS